MFKNILITTFLALSLFATDNESSSALTKQKIEIRELKKELNTFYNQKEEEYKKRKQELEKLLNEVKKERAEIQDLHDRNLALLQDINGTAKSKTAKIYNSMKPKIAASIIFFLLFYIILLHQYFVSLLLTF